MEEPDDLVTSLDPNPSEPQSNRFVPRKPYRRETALFPDSGRLSLDQFQVIRTIGTGSYSRVLLAKHIPSGLPVALKTMNKTRILQSLQLLRVFYERSILRLMESPFIVHYIGSFQDPSNLYVALEYVPGGELFKMMLDHDRFSATEALFYTAEISYALLNLHAINCVYRDLKPENVLLTATGHIKLADFGSAKIIDLHMRTFTLCGTPEYLAPEVIDRNGHSCASDWWQVGVLLYEMMAAYPPFTDQSPYRLYEKILMSKLECPKFFSPEIVELLTGLLAKRPRDRLNDAEVRNHPTFKSVDWTKIMNREVQPPFVPQLSDPFDSSNFEMYEEEDGECEPLSEELNRQFESF